MEINRSQNSAFLWQLGGGLFQTIVRLGGSYVLARNILPDEYGLFALALLYQTLVSFLFSAGFGSALIYRQIITQVYYSTCYLSMACIKLLMFLFAFSTSGIVEVFFEQDGLEEIIQLVSITFLLTIPEGVGQSMLQKELRYKTLNLIRLSCIFIETIVAVFCVLAFDMGLMALVVAMLINAALCFFLFALTSTYKVTFDFSISAFKDMLHFGVHGLGFSMVNYAMSYFDQIVIGKVLGASSLGIYEFAGRVPGLVLEKIARAIGSTVFPTLSSVESKSKEFDLLLSKGVVVITALSAPFLIYLICLADKFVLWLWGEQWLGVITPLRILCVYFLIRCICQPGFGVNMSRGKPKANFLIALVSFAILAVSIFPLMNRLGVVGAAYAMVLSVFPSIYLFVSVVNNYAKAPFSIFSYVWWLLFFSIVSCIPLLLVKNLIIANDFLTLILSGLVGVTVYVASILVFKRKLVNLILNKESESV